MTLAINQYRPLNPLHLLNAGLVGEWNVVPGSLVGVTWLDMVRGLAKHNNATLAGGAVIYGLAPPGGWGSVTFDATDDTATTAFNITSYGTLYSAAFWWRTTGSTNTRGMLGVGNHRFTMRSASAAFAIQRNAGGFESQASTVTPAAGTWYRVLATNAGANAGDVKIYVNGVDKTGTATAITAVGSATTAIGANSGLVGEASGTGVQIWRRALSPPEAWLDYQEHLAGNPNRYNWLSSRRYFFGGAAAAGGNRRRRVLLAAD